MPMQDAARVTTEFDANSFDEIMKHVANAAPSRVDFIPPMEDACDRCVYCTIFLDTAGCNPDFSVSLSRDARPR